MQEQSQLDRGAALVEVTLKYVGIFIIVVWDEGPRWRASEFPTSFELISFGFYSIRGMTCSRTL